MPSAPHLPVSAGSRRFESAEVDGFRVVDAWFPPDAVLERHLHERTCFGVMLDGGFDLEFSVGPYPCTPTTVFTEPLGEGHANRVSRAGAHVVVIQPDPGREELLRPVADLLDRINHFRDAEIATLARRLGKEVRRRGPAAELAIEGLALEILTAARRRDGRRNTPRRLRLEWAADQLRTTILPLPAIALRAGFADQSHFTRAFRREFGVTPGVARARDRSGRG